MSSIFYGCSNLESADLTGWNTGKSSEFGNFFRGCSKLNNLKGIENWNTQNTRMINNMFLGCSSLTKLDLSQ